MNIKRKLHDFFCTIIWSQNYIWFRYPCSSSFRCCYKDTNNSNNSFMCLKGMTPDFFLKSPQKKYYFARVFWFLFFHLQCPSMRLYLASLKTAYFNRQNALTIGIPSYIWTQNHIANSNNIIHV